MPRKMDFEKKYRASEAPPFDQRNEMFKRSRWEEDPELRKKWQAFRGPIQPDGKNGASHENLALRAAGWDLEMSFARGCATSDFGLYKWDEKRMSVCSLADDVKFDAGDPDYTARVVKKAARHFGAGVVGITKLDRRWIYSQECQVGPQGCRERELNVPDDCEYAIVIATEMDYEELRYTPTYAGSATVALGYSQMAFTAGLMGQFIKHLGYKAIPCGNDTALSVPLAIQAGLGELGRNGILITREFGPRVRLTKIFTDLPMACDEPVEFGVEAFCETCKLCATQCPSRAIPEGERTTEGPNECNASGPLKWYVNGMKCLDFWGRAKCDCGTCIRVCPFNKPNGRIHDAARWFIDYVPQLNGVMLKADTMCGYGKMANPDTFWDED